MRAMKFGLGSLLTGIPSSMIHSLKRNRRLGKVSASAVALAAVLLLLVPVLAVAPSAGATAPTLTNGVGPSTNIVGPDSDLAQVGQQAVPEGPLNFLGMPAPTGEVQAQSFAYHWWRGAVWPSSVASQTATSVEMSMTTPPEPPNPSVIIYVCESTFDNDGSYVQIGMDDWFGTLYAFYSYTTGPVNNLTYIYNPTWLTLAPNTSYWFDMVIEPSGTVFYVDQYVAGSWVTIGSFATNDAATAMYLQWGYQGAYCYTDYEEVYTNSASYVPEDNFFFKRNVVVINGSGYYQNLWDQMGAYPPIVVQKSFADVTIDNSATDAAVPRINGSYPSSVVVGQPITITLGATNTSGFTASRMHVELSFPSLTSASDVTVNSSPPHGLIYSAGDTVLGRYGYGTFPVVYDLADFYDDSWAGGTTESLQVTVPGQNYGTFTFYAASVIALDIGNPFGSGSMHNPDGFAPSTPQDQRGEWVSKYTITIKDVTPPTTTLKSLTPANPQCNGWYNTPVTVALSAQDDPGGSGVAYTEYSLDNGATWNLYNGPFQVTQQGSINVKAYSVDNAGNVETPPKLLATLKIDTVAPTTTITLDPLNPNGCNGFWITPVKVTVTGFDSGSGVNYVVYSLHGGNGPWIVVHQNPYTFTVNTSGYYLLQAYSADNACNTGNPATLFNFNVDVTPPTVNIVAPADGAILQGTYTFAAQASDDFSGVQQVYGWLRADTGGLGTPIGYEKFPMTYNSGTWVYTVNTDNGSFPDGCYLFIAQSEDNACNWSAQAVVHFRVHNWAVTQVGSLPTPPRAGVLGNYKFLVRVAPSVDPRQPNVSSQDLVIKIFATSNPGNILKTSTWGPWPSVTNYWIDPMGVYHVEFQSLTRPMQYTIAVFSSCGTFIGQYNITTKGMFGY